MIPEHERIQLAVSTGEPAGVGPEIFLMTLADVWEYPLAKLKVFGPRTVLFECARKLVPKLQVGVDEIVGGSLECETVDINNPGVHWNPGKPDKDSARVAWKSIDAAIDAVLTSDCAALVTGPISKVQMMSIGFPFPGHTDYLAAKMNTPDPVMLYDSPTLRVALVTTHIPLHDVSQKLSKDRIVRVGRLLCNYLNQMNKYSPRIAIAGLNPHGGIGDVFGSEEDVIISPAVKALRSLGMDVEGPVPPDTVFMQAREGKFDAVISLYHDQGSIPVKTLDFQHTVNVTLGLPIIRTSVDHGTAFSIAGKGEASHLNMKAAISLACQLAWNRPRQNE